MSVLQNAADRKSRKAMERALSASNMPAVIQGTSRTAPRAALVAKAA